MKNETPFHVTAHVALPLALPQMRLEHVEYTGLVEIEEVPGSDGELFFCRDTNEILQHVDEYVIVVKFD